MRRAKFPKANSAGLFRSRELIAWGQSRAAWRRCRAPRRLGCMISIPIAEEAYEALKARIPGSMRPPRPKAGTGGCGSRSIANLSTGSWSSGSRARATATLFCGWLRPGPMFLQPCH